MRTALVLLYIISGCWLVSGTLSKTDAKKSHKAEVSNFMSPPINSFLSVRVRACQIYLWNVSKMNLNYVFSSRWVNSRALEFGFEVSSFVFLVHEY